MCKGYDHLCQVIQQIIVKICNIRVAFLQQFEYSESVHFHIRILRTGYEFFQTADFFRCGCRCIHHIHVCPIDAFHNRCPFDEPFGRTGIGGGIKDAQFFSGHQIRKFSRSRMTSTIYPFVFDDTTADAGSQNDGDTILTVFQVAIPGFCQSCSLTVIFQRNRHRATAADQLNHILIL